MFSKLFSLLMLFCIGATFINAQSYYEVGKVYTFKGTTADETKEVTISVIFDKTGLATISRQATESTTAIGTVNYLAAAGTLKVEKAGLSIADPKAKLWLISFDPGTPTMPMRIGGQAAVTINCPCKSSGVCEVSIQSTGNGGCFTCVPGADCRRCGTPTYTNSSLVGGSYLVLEAASISFEENK